MATSEEVRAGETDYSDREDAVAYSSDIEKQEDEKEPSDTIAEKEAERDPNIVTWDGDNDPENPMNWPTSRKIAAIGIVSFITLLS